MAKQLFGNLVTYSGKYLSTATAKAKNGNLVFARITKSTELDPTHEDYDKDGYYIYAGGAEGHLVTRENFLTLKSQVADLETKVGSLTIGNKTYADVPAYVAAQLENYVLKSSVKASFDGAEDGDVASVGAVKSYVSGIVSDELGDAAYKGVAAVIRENGTADDEHLATEKAVRDAISTLGTVMDFKGVVEGESLPATTNYATGDVIIWNSEEYVLGTDSVWHEIGRVKEDEAVLTLTSGNENHLTFNKATGAVTATVVTAEVAEGATGVAVAGDVYSKIETAKSDLSDRIDELEEYNKSYVDQTAEVNSNAAAITVTPDATAATTTGVTTYTLDIDVTELNKLVEKAHRHNATEVDIDAITIEGVAATTATTVQEALQDLYNSNKVTAESLVDIYARLDGHDSDIDDINTAIKGINKTIEELDKVAVVDGNDNDFVTVSKDTAANDDVTYTVTATLAAQPPREAGTAAVATGLATDAYVADAIANALTWEVLSDEASA